MAVVLVAWVAPKIEPAARTFKLTFAVVDAVPYFAVTVYSVKAASAVGVPLIAHVVVLIVSPAGKVGETVQSVIVPVVVGVSVVITASFTYVNGPPV